MADDAMCCFFCGVEIDDENDVTDAYSELRGILKVHRGCAGAAQDELDDEFNEHEQAELDNAQADDDDLPASAAC